MVVSAAQKGVINYTNDSTDIHGRILIANIMEITDERPEDCPELTEEVRQYL